MGYTNSFLSQLSYFRNRGAFQGGDAALAIGTYDFLIEWQAIKRFGVDGISEEDIKTLNDLRNGGSAPEDWLAACAGLNSKLWKSLGYRSYIQLDINAAADIVWDLNIPLPEEFDEIADAVVDGTTYYVTNIRQALHNVMRMVKVGGEYLIGVPIDNEINRFDLSPSPNFLIDLFTNSGFEVVDAVVLDKDLVLEEGDSRIIQYDREKFRNKKLCNLEDILPDSVLCRLRYQQFLKSSIKRFVPSRKVARRILWRVGRIPRFGFKCLMRKVSPTPSQLTHGIKDIYSNSSILENNMGRVSGKARALLPEKRASAPLVGSE